MKVNYVLMYGIPYVRYKEFETFEDISKFLLHKGFVNYSIFKKLEDKEELEMIYRDNDIRYLENFVEEQYKEIKRLNKQIEEYQKSLDETTSEKIDLENTIKEVREYVENYNIGMPYDHFVMKESLLEILDKENK